MCVCMLACVHVCAFRASVEGGSEGVLYTCTCISFAGGEIIWQITNAAISVEFPFTPNFVRLPIVCAY